MTGFVTAVRLLTRIGPRSGTTYDPAGAVMWLPVIGAGVGATGGGAYWALRAVATPLLSAIVAVMTVIWITGALHEDGLADTADAFGTHDAAAARRAMKDPRVGTFGTLALGFSLLVRIAALASLAPLDGLRAMIATHAAGRFAILVATTRGQPGDEDALGGSFTRSVRRRQRAAGLSIGALLVSLSVGTAAIGALAVAVVVAIAVCRQVRMRSGDITGDTFGAVEQVTEIAVIAGLSFATILWA